MLGAPAHKPPKLIRIISPGHRTTLVDGHQGDQITGNTRGSDGTVYYNVVSDDASRNGTWKLPPHGRPQRLAALPADSLPNGLAIDPTGRTLYVADSLNGTVWAMSVSGGPARVWLTGPALAPDPGASLELGVNGLRFHKGAVWVSNFNQGTLLRIPVTAHGTPGPLRTVADNLPDVDDFSFLDNRSDTVFAAQNDTTDRVSVVHPNRTTRTALTVDDGLASPTTTAVRGNHLYIADAGFARPTTPSCSAQPSTSTGSSSSPAGSVRPPRRGSRRWSRTDGCRRADRGSTSSRTLPSGRPGGRRRTEWCGAPTRDRAPR